MCRKTTQAGRTIFCLLRASVDLNHSFPRLRGAWPGSTTGPWEQPRKKYRSPKAATSPEVRAGQARTPLTDLLRRDPREELPDIDRCEVRTPGLRRETKLLDSKFPPRVRDSRRLGDTAFRTNPCPERPIQNEVASPGGFGRRVVQSGRLDENLAARISSLMDSWATWLDWGGRNTRDNSWRPPRCRHFEDPEGARLQTDWPSPPKKKRTDLWGRGRLHRLHDRSAHSLCKRGFGRKLVPSGRFAWLSQNPGLRVS